MFVVQKHILRVFFVHFIDGYLQKDILYDETIISEWGVCGA